MAKDNSAALVERPVPISIDDVVVADPSIQFNLIVDEDADDLFIRHLEVQISLLGLKKRDGAFRNGYKLVGTVRISGMKGFPAFIHIPFGDPGYEAGNTFSLCVFVSGYFRTGKNEGKPINFKDNPYYIHGIIGGSN